MPVRNAACAGEEAMADAGELAEGLVFDRFWHGTLRFHFASIQRACGGAAAGAAKPGKAGSCGERTPITLKRVPMPLGAISRATPASISPARRIGRHQP